MPGVSKKEMKEALEKAKEVEKSEDIYSIQKLQEEDGWFKQQAKKITFLLGKFPVGIQRKETKMKKSRVKKNR